MDGSGPRTARGERTRARVRDAARQTFRERGYAAARVEDVVALAGVSHGTFYTYFDNRAAVLDALIDDTAAELQAVLDAPWDGPDGSSAITGVIERFVAVFAAHGDVVRVWTAAAATESHFAARLAEVRAGYVRRVADGLAPVLASSAHDAQDAAAALVAMVEGYAMHGLAGDPDERRDAVVRTLSALWLGGLVRLAEDDLPR